MTDPNLGLRGCRIDKLELVDRFGVEVVRHFALLIEDME